MNKFTLLLFLFFAWDLFLVDLKVNKTVEDIKYLKSWNHVKKLRADRVDEVLGLRIPQATPVKIIDKRIRVAVIDTGLNKSSSFDGFLCEDGHRNYTTDGDKNNLVDKVNHGTAMAGLVIRGMNKKTHCLMIIRLYDFSGMMPSLFYTESILNIAEYLNAYKVKFVNFSINGEGSLKEEKQAFKNLIDAGVTVTTAAGNKSVNLSSNCNYYPACYDFKSPNFIVVGALNSNGEVSSYSNYNGTVNHYEYGGPTTVVGFTLNGTSVASAVTMSKILNGTYIK